MISDTVLGQKDFDEIPPTAVAASKWLVEIWERLGRPEDPFSTSGTQVMNVIIAVWEELYPKESKDWHQSRKDYKKAELSIREQLAGHTGRSLASYPYPIFGMMKTIFPNFKPANRENCMKIVSKWPMFQMANKK